MLPPTNFTSPTHLSILLVDDEPSIRLGLGDALRGHGYRVVAAHDGRTALEALTCQTFDVVLCDVRLPHVDGMGVLHSIRQRTPTTDVLMMTGYGTVSDAVAAVKEGALDYLTKPVQISQLVQNLQRIARERALRQDLEDARRMLEEARTDGGLIGRSPLMLQLLAKIEKFGSSDAPVLITGESGTGKELVAASLHRRSPRGDKPFLAVNCAAFPETLLEAELFGHERGAFTGAIKKRDGRFKAADGGTLLLDEVAEMPLPAQAKLLRVLQEHSFEPLGTNESVRVDVRILSATHRALKQLVSQGRFREDLYYRLKILEIETPPLRERRSDLPLLVEHFLRRFSVGAKPPGVSARAMAAFEDHSFPGNVRELEHAIRHAIALTPAGQEIDLVHLPADMVGTTMAAQPPTPALRTLATAVKTFERDYLRSALRVSNGSRTRTAAMLGISRKNLWEKLRRHALVDPDEDDSAGQEPTPAGSRKPSCP